MKLSGVKMVSWNALRTDGDRLFLRGRDGKSCGGTFGIPSGFVGGTLVVSGLSIGFFVYALAVVDDDWHRRPDLPPKKEAVEEAKGAVVLLAQMLMTTTKTVVVVVLSCFFFFYVARAKESDAFRCFFDDDDDDDEFFWIFSSNSFRCLVVGVGSFFRFGSLFFCSSSPFVCLCVHLSLSLALLFSSLLFSSLFLVVERSVLVFEKILS